MGMRKLVDRGRLLEFMKALGRAADEPSRVYLLGGACALWHGWRSTTLDVDLNIVPDCDAIYRAIPMLKKSLSMNVELVVPNAFLPELAGWQNRSIYIESIGKAEFYHLDFYTQALSKLERSHERDLTDVASMLADGLVEPSKLRLYLDELLPKLYRYPAVDPASFQAAVEAFLEEAGA